MLISTKKINYAVNIVLDQLKALKITAQWLNPPMGKEVNLGGYTVKIQTSKRIKQEGYSIKFGTSGSIPVIFIENEYPEFTEYMESFNPISKDLYLRILKQDNADPNNPHQVKKHQLGIISKKNRNIDYLTKWSNAKFGSEWNKKELPKKNRI